MVQRCRIDPISNRFGLPKLMDSYSADCHNKKFKKKTASKKGQTKIYSVNDAPVLPEEYDSDKVGYYCTSGHYLGGYKDMPKNCPKCNKSTTVTEFRHTI